MLHLITDMASSLCTPDALVRQEAAEVRLDLRVNAWAVQKVLNQDRHLQDRQKSVHMQRETLS